MNHYRIYQSLPTWLRWLFLTGGRSTQACPSAKCLSVRYNYRLCQDHHTKPIKLQICNRVICAARSAWMKQRNILQNTRVLCQDSARSQYEASIVLRGRSLHSSTSTACHEIALFSCGPKERLFSITSMTTDQSAFPCCLLKLYILNIYWPWSAW